MSNTAFYMKRCLELARKGKGNVSPNPMVGCVIEHDGLIIGEGYHMKYGGHHAEVNAINSVDDKTLLSKSTLYVNLEPCSHFGKTPPCTDLIIKYKIPKVVIGSLDSNEKVSGKGVEKLKREGCEVVVGVLENDCRFLNRRFFTFHEKKRPYIILKWAQTKDGFIDKMRSGSLDVGPNWITAEETRVIVHKWRTEEDAIMVATNTAMIDNPSLTARDWLGKNPARIVLDNTLKLPLSLNVFNNNAKTFIINTEQEIQKDHLYYIKLSFDENMLTNLCKRMFDFGVQSVIVEGGAQLHNSFIEKKIWDEARVFVGNVDFKEGVKSPMLQTKPDKILYFECDKLQLYYNKRLF